MVAGSSVAKYLVGNVVRRWQTPSQRRASSGDRVRSSNATAGGDRCSVEPGPVPSELRHVAASVEPSPSVETWVAWRQRHRSLNEPPNPARVIRLAPEFVFVPSSVDEPTGEERVLPLEPRSGPTQSPPFATTDDPLPERSRAPKNLFGEIPSLAAHDFMWGRTSSTSPPPLPSMKTPFRTTENLR